MFVSWSRDKHLVCILILLMFVIDSCASGISSRTPCVHNRIYIMVFFIFYPCINEATRKSNIQVMAHHLQTIKYGKAAIWLHAIQWSYTICVSSLALEFSCTTSYYYFHYEKLDFGCKFEVVRISKFAF